MYSILFLIDKWPLFFGNLNEINKKEGWKSSLINYFASLFIVYQISYIVIDMQANGQK